MSKEVEAAIKRIRNTIVYLGRKSGKTRYFEDINLIIEQAERVDILLEQTGHNFEVNRKLDAQNQRYREAIDEALTELKCGDAYNLELILAEVLEDKE